MRRKNQLMEQLLFKLERFKVVKIVFLDRF